MSTYTLYQKTISGKRRKGDDGKEGVRGDMMEYAGAIGKAAHTVSIGLFEEVVAEEFGQLPSNDGLSIYFSRSCYVAGIPYPAGNDIAGSRSVEVFGGRRRIMIRMFATHCYYGNDKLRFDTVMLNAG